MKVRRPAKLSSARTYVGLLGILAIATILRLSLLPKIHNPGLHDSIHYNNLGRRLLSGDGFTIDYVWHYSRMPVEIEHPIDHWMPVAGIAAAVGMLIGGETVHGSLVLFVGAGVLVPLLVFRHAKQLSCSNEEAQIAALITAVLPDVVLNSLRTDTTILSMVFLSSAVILLNNATISKRLLSYALSGFLFGLGYLTRNDAIVFLPILVLYSLAASFCESRRSTWRGFLIVTSVFVLTVAPWLLRNLNYFGMLGSAAIGRMPFMLEPIDSYAYGLPISLESLLERASLLELVGQRLFELAAAFKQIAVSLDIPLLMFTPLGAIWLLRGRIRARVLFAFFGLTWTILMLVVYPIFMPVLSRSGSFEKGFLTILPLLTPLGVLGMRHLVRNRSALWVIAAVSLLWLSWRSCELVDQSTALADTYYDSMRKLAAALETLPDTNGDERYILMSQDPYVLSDLGYASVVTPYASRKDTLELARQFAVDYLLMPAGRPSLDPLYLGEESDHRFELALHLADAGEIPFELFRFKALG